MNHRDDLGLRFNVTMDVIPVRNAKQDAAIEAMVRQGRYLPGSLAVRQSIGHNMVTDVGLAVIAAGLAGTAPTITNFGVGSSSTAENASQTGLIAESTYPSGVSPRFTITIVTSEDEVATAQHYISSAHLNSQTLREAGLFAGTSLVARYVYNDADLQPKTSAVAVVFSWTLTLARA